MVYRKKGDGSLPRRNRKKELRGWGETWRFSGVNQAGQVIMQLANLKNNQVKGEGRRVGEKAGQERWAE